MRSGTRKSRKGLYVGVGAALVVAIGAAGLTTITGAAPEVDAARLATAERATIVKSVVATGKVEPITKIEIKSKANGIIKALNADTDRVVNPGDILVELDREQLAAALRGAEANLLAARVALEAAEAQLKKNIVEAEGPDAEFARRAHVRLGQPARIRVETFKDKVFDGQVTQISPMGVEKDNVTTFEVRVSIDNPGKALKANMTANAEIVLEEHPNALVVPESAITYDAQKNAFVDVVSIGAKNGRKKAGVKTGVSNGTKIEILDGLEEGDKVVLPS